MHTLYTALFTAVFTAVLIAILHHFSVKISKIHQTTPAFRYPFVYFETFGLPHTLDVSRLLIGCGPTPLHLMHFDFTLTLLDKGSFYRSPPSLHRLFLSIFQLYSNCKPFQPALESFILQVLHRFNPRCINFHTISAFSESTFCARP